MYGQMQTNSTKQSRPIIIHHLATRELCNHSVTILHQHQSMNHHFATEVQ